VILECVILILLYRKVNVRALYMDGGNVPVRVHEQMISMCPCDRLFSVCIQFSFSQSLLLRRRGRILCLLARTACYR
jgi:hypothetical protein